MSFPTPFCETTLEYGQLSSRSLDSFFTEASDADLRHVVNNAPASLRTALPENAEGKLLLF